MAKEGTLLIVDDNRSILSALRLLLEKYFARVLTLPTPNRLATTLREERIDVVLLDMNFTAGINTGNEGIYWLREIHARRPDVKVVLFTAYADIDLAVRAMRDGAVDFVVKPWDNDRLVASLRNAYNLARSQREVKQLKEIKRELKQEEPMFWGGSPAMARIREIVEKVAATDANIRKALKEQLAGMTTIIIAQRVASVMDADQILVMENGRIRDRGTHAELMESSDIYRELYESQQKGVE